MINKATFKNVTKNDLMSFALINGSYDNISNVFIYLNKYTENEYSYDKIFKQIIINGEIENNIDYIYNIVNDVNKNLYFSKNIFVKGLTEYCKGCQKKTEQEKKEADKKAREERKEADRKAKEEERKIQQEIKTGQNAKKEEAKRNQDKYVKTYIEHNYDSKLASTKNGVVYYDNHKMGKTDVSAIVRQCRNIKGCSKYPIDLIKAYIKEIAYKHIITPPEENNDVNNSVDIFDEINNDNWLEYLEYDEGVLKHTIKNYAIYLQFHPRLRDRIRYDLFRKVGLIKKKDDFSEKEYWYPIDDQQLSGIYISIEEYFGGKCVTNNAWQALEYVLSCNKFNPFVEKLNSLSGTWDGKPRAREIFIKYFKVDDNDYTREMTEVMLCGSLKRVLEEKPTKGAEFDQMGVLFGGQGTGKTKFITKLYFGDEFVTLKTDVGDQKQFSEDVQSSFCCIMDEMGEMKSKEIAMLKSVITTPSYKYRAAYKRNPEMFPVHCVFWGNTNNDYLFVDNGDERRFIVFNCKTNKYERTPEWWAENFTEHDIEQIWAEALMIYEAKWKEKYIMLSKECSEYNQSLVYKRKRCNCDVKTKTLIMTIFNKPIFNVEYFGEYEMNEFIFNYKNFIVSQSTNRYELLLININWIYEYLNTPVSRYGQLYDIATILKYNIIDVNEEDELCVKIGTGKFLINKKHSVDEIRQRILGHGMQKLSDVIAETPLGTATKTLLET